MGTVRELLGLQRRAARREARNLVTTLRLVPQEILDLEMDVVHCYKDAEKEGGEIRLTLVVDSVAPGVVSMILGLSDDEEVEVQKSWSTGNKYWKFDLGKTKLTLRVHAEGCKKYRVVEKEVQTRTIEVCGEIDRSLYASVEYIGEV